MGKTYKSLEKAINLMEAGLRDRKQVERMTPEAETKLNRLRTEIITDYWDKEDRKGAAAKLDQLLELDPELKKRYYSNYGRDDSKSEEDKRLFFIHNSMNDVKQAVRDVSNAANINSAGGVSSAQDARDMYRALKGKQVSPYTALISALDNVNVSWKDSLAVIKKASDDGVLEGKLTGNYVYNALHEIKKSDINVNDMVLYMSSFSELLSEHLTVSDGKALTHITDLLTPGSLTVENIPFLNSALNVISKLLRNDESSVAIGKFLADKFRKDSNFESLTPDEQFDKVRNGFPTSESIDNGVWKTKIGSTLWQAIIPGIIQTYEDDRHKQNTDRDNEYNARKKAEADKAAYDKSFKGKLANTGKKIKNFFTGRESEEIELRFRYLSEVVQVNGSLLHSMSLTDPMYFDENYVKWRSKNM